MMKTLLIGAEGQLGQELQKYLPHSIATSRSSKNHYHLSLENSSDISKIVRELRPAVIVNCAALTSVDKCEREKDLAYIVNGESVRTIVEEARSIGATLVQVSTDYVFDGKSGNYDETSTPSPVNYYGFSKLVGDTYANAYENSLIVRTSGVFGHSRNFPRYVYEKLSEKSRVDVLKGYYSPIHATNLALSIISLLKTGTKGVVNVAGTRISREEMAQSIAKRFGFDLDLIRTVDSIDTLIAKRPFDSSLNIDKASRLIEFDFYSIESNLELFEASLN